MSKKHKNNKKNRKETILKILNTQNDVIESAMESINAYLCEIYAHNASLTHILMNNLK